MRDETFDQYEHLKGNTVAKRSRKTFKSGETINMVLDLVVMDKLSDIKGYTVIGVTFVEDDSVVEARILEIVEE